MGSMEIFGYDLADTSTDSATVVVEVSGEDFECVNAWVFYSINELLLWLDAIREAKHRER